MSQLFPKEVCALLQVTLLLLSFAGYFLLLYVLLQGRRTALYPALVASGMMVAGFLGGLANCLQAVYSLVYWGGFALLPVGMGLLMLRRRTLARPGLHSLLPFAVLIAGAYLLYAAFEGRFLYIYDDFSHWGKVARVISENMRLPVEADQLSHGAYPPGSALFLAYVSSVAGGSDRVWLFAHTLLHLSFWIALLGISRRLLVQLGLAGLLAYFMHYIAQPISLYVDILLAAAAFACMAYCLQGRGEDSFLPLALMLSALTLLKNSGVFLAGMIAVFAVFLYWRENKRLSPRLLTLLLPFALLLAWNAYCGVYLAQASSHQMSVSHYQAVLGDKSAEDLRTMLKIILPLMTDPHQNHALALVPGYLAVLWVLKRQGKLRENGPFFGFAAIALVLYELGTLGMYLFSMPMYDLLAHNGDDYARYNGTITALLAALLLALVCRVWLLPAGRERWQHTLRRILYAGVPAAAAVWLVYQLLMLHYMPLKPLEYRINRSQTAYHFSLMREELAALPGDAACIILQGEPDSGGYHRCIAQYYLKTADVESFYTRGEALARRTERPDSYYIDLFAGVIYSPEEELPTAAEGIVNLLDTQGYWHNARYSVSAEKDVDAFYWDITGYIPIVPGDVIRLKHVTWQVSTENEGRGSIYWYDAEKGYLASFQTKSADQLDGWQPVYDGDGNIVQITVSARVGNAAYLRICCQDIGADSVITVNQEIP